MSVQKRCTSRNVAANVHDKAKKEAAAPKQAGVAMPQMARMQTGKNG
jgi:hypothetical protein